MEEMVLNKLKDGDVPNEFEIDQMLRELITSPEARTKGFVLDLDFPIFDKITGMSWVSRFE